MNLKLDYHSRRPAIFGWLIMAICIGASVAGCSSSQPSPAASADTIEYPSSPNISTFKPYKIDDEWYEPVINATGFRQQGIASWYGEDFHGKKTASGEIYDMYAMTAAHKTLPMGTYVRVTRQENGKSIIVRINDRGPYVRKRIIDLSYSAAGKLDIVGPGSAPVEIVALGAAVIKKTATGNISTYQPIDYDHGTFTFQIGAFKDFNNAARLKNKLAQDYTNLHINTYQTGHGTFYRVRLGKCRSLREALQFERHLIRAGFKDAFTVAE